MRALFAAALVALLASVAHAHVYFTADMILSDDSTMPGGIARGKMYYFYNETYDAFNHFLRIDYTSPVNMIELINYTSATRYKYCGTCFAEKFIDDADDLFYKSGDTRCAADDYTGCTCYTRTTGSLKKYWVQSTDTAVLCKATIVRANGVTKTYTFSNFVKSVAAGTFDIRFQWTCPAPICRRVMDIVLVFDESGSIDGTEWSQMISFAKQLVNQFEVSIEATNFGVVYFAWTSRLISGLKKDKDSVLNALSTGNIGGATCIGCGVTVGVQNVLPKKVAGRPANPAEIMMTLTDGGNNCPEPNDCRYYGYYCDFPPTTPDANLTAAVQLLKNRQVTSIAIGVDGYVQSQLDLIASDITGVQTVLTVSNFAQLPTIIEKLVSNTCTELPVLPCGDMCYGFCSCDQECACPVCPEINPCFTNNCTVRPDGTSEGCIIKPVNCDDNSKCTIDSCNNATGCVNTQINCDDGNECTVDDCDPGSGCTNEPRTDCNKGNPCYEYGCDTSTGCWENLICDDDPCYIGTCTATGCTYQWGCDDGDACTHDSCYDDGSIRECRHTAVNPATECDDGDFCTDDFCMPTLTVTPGCSHRPHDCNNGSACADLRCDVATQQCVDDPDTDCTGCGIWLDAGNNCTSPDPCKIGYCVTVNPTTGECHDYDKNCSVYGDHCNNYYCNATTGECMSTPVKCADGICLVGKCNETDGSCYTVPKNCTSSTDPCWIDYCDDVSGECRRRSFCEEIPCQVMTCTAVGNTATCSYVDLNCSTGNACRIGYCDNATSTCKVASRMCTDGLVCTDDECDRDFGCVFPNKSCDDGDPCTLDFCSESVVGGCYHEPKCSDGLFCTEDVCTFTGECIFRELSCNLDLTSPGKECFVEACSEERHCYYKTSNSAFLDVCGNCIQTYGTNISVWNNSWIRTACVESMTWPEYVAALTAAALGGIIVAAIIVALILAVGGFFGTKEVIRRAKLAANQAAVNNPLYQDTGREMTNPAYTGNE